MTYLKRMAFHMLMLVVGAILALLVLEFTAKHIVVKPILSYLLMALFMALCLAISQLVVGRLFPLDEAQAAVAPTVRKQTWAWLRPNGDGVRSGFPLNKDHMLIGREVKCAIMLNDNSVSRQHSSITRLAEGYLIKDLGSSNGTYVNGQRVQEYLLQDGDSVSIGDIEFYFEAPADANPLGNTGGQVFSQGPSGGGGGGDAFGGGGFSLDPSGGGFGFGDDDEEEEGTEAWHPRPEDLR